jgi:hypothetical protein
VAIDGGRVHLLIEDETGRVIWQDRIDQTGELPHAPVLAMTADHAYSLVIAAGTADTSARVEGLSVKRPAEVHRLPQQRRYGAMMW